MVYLGGILGRGGLYNVRGMGLGEGKKEGERDLSDV